MGVSTTYTYHGEIRGMTKGNLERSIESDKELVTTFYNSTFVKKMVAVNNVVNTWQRGVR